MNKSMLPAVIGQQLPLLAVEIAEPKKLKIVWERIVDINYYQSAINALLPVMGQVDNSNLLKVRPHRKGCKTVRLSVVDIWEDKKLPFPEMTEIFLKIANAGKDPAGIIEFALFAKIIIEEDVLADYDDLYVFALREYMTVKHIKSFPSLSRDDQDGVLLGMTYDWAISKCHGLFLVVD